MKWAVEICAECGQQLGPGLLSPSPSGRCPGHEQIGGIVLVMEVDDAFAAEAARRARSPYWRPENGLQSPAHVKLREVPSPDTPERCPTCGSDDPCYDKAGTARKSRAIIFERFRCPDPFHDPAAQEGGEDG